MRRAAAARLARLAEEQTATGPLVAAAHPAGWWGLRERTHSAAPVRAEDAPLDMSASMLGGLLECSLRWFLAREAAGEAPRSTAMGFGNVLHVLADHLVKADDATAAELTTLLDSVWTRLSFDSPWIAVRERAEAQAAIARLLAWHRSRPDREVVATEADFAAELRLEEGDAVRLRGRVDRLEREADGSLHIVDLKTSKNPPSGTSLPDNPQLGLYQLAANLGAFEGIVGDDARSGGAELVQLRVAAGSLPKVQAQPPQLPDEAGRTPVEVQLTTAAATVRSERFDASVGTHCTFCDFRALCPAQVRSGTVIS